jgi:hypothetical protein
MAKASTIVMAVAGGILAACVGGVITGVGCATIDRRSEPGDPSQKARVYAVVISESMNSAAFYALITVPLSVWWALRRKPRGP